jgi:hypothetical protein
MTAPLYVDCPECDGHGERVECVNDGPTGCSHVLDEPQMCRRCTGTGELELARAVRGWRCIYCAGINSLLLSRCGGCSLDRPTDVSS